MSGNVPLPQPPPWPLASEPESSVSQGEPAQNGHAPAAHDAQSERPQSERPAKVNRGSTRFYDIAGMLAGGIPEPPKPLVLTRDDGHAIFYAGQVNIIFGDPESGKTMIALAAIQEIAKANRRSLFIDMDHNGPASVVSRLIALGVSPAYLGDPTLFRYIEPEDRMDLLDIVDYMINAWRPAVVVVDSVGELLPLLGRKSNDPDDFTVAHSDVLKPLAHAGACVIAVDHLAKAVDSRAQGPTGTAAKRRTPGGASIRVSIHKQFAPGKGGSAWLTINKDRHGGLRQWCPVGDREPSAGLFVIESVGDSMVWNIKQPSGMDQAQISGVQPGDVLALDGIDPEPSSVRDVADRLHWGTSRAAATLREWRRQRYGNVPEERVTP